MAGSVVKPLSLDATCTGISATLEPNFFIQFETPSRIEIVTPSNLGGSHARLVASATTRFLKVSLQRRRVVLGLAAMSVPPN